MKYLEQVKKVNASYGNNLNMGYDTERGRVYLQYGPPNAIADSYFRAEHLSLRDLALLPIGKSRTAECI
jgi:GWxTD domain-containing protein